VTTTPKIVSVQSAGPGILELILESASEETGSPTVPDVLDTAPTSYLVNGKPPVAISRSSLPWNAQPVAANGAYPITVRHSLFLQLGEPFQERKVYSVVCGYGDGSFTFESRKTATRSIKVNQAGYASAATIRFANLGIWLGDAGALKLDVPPTYEVIRESDGTVVFKGTAAAPVDDTGLSGPKSGEIVYRLPLDAVSEGGAYFVSVPGIGRSRSFGIGNAFTRQSARVSMLGLTIARCGQELRPPWSPWTRPACHLQVADTRVPWGSAEFIQVPQGAAMVARKGGRHDAGDYDKRPMHTIIPILLLTYFEAWPSHFVDGQYGLPEDGNGIPGILNEAMWDVIGWELLQVSDPKDPQYGGVRSGSEQCAHPTYGVHSADHDRCAYGTWGVDGPANSPAEGLTAYVAGIFAQASRLIRPYNAARADELLGKAKLAWAYHARANDPVALKAFNLYASLQLYLATGDASFHDLFKPQAQAMVVGNGPWPQTYMPGNFGESGAQVQTVHFASYTLPTTRPVDTALVTAIKARVTREADSGGYMSVRPLNAPYPVLANKFYAWGAPLRPFDPPAWASLYATDAAKRQQYINVMSLQADAILGLNAMGMSYVVGLGTDQPNSPLHLDSYFAQRDTGKLLPGVMVYGPQDGRSGLPYQLAVTNKLFPAFEQLPICRRFVHGWSAAAFNEDTPWQTRVWFAVTMGFLHDASRDPKPVPQPLPSPPPAPSPPQDGVQLTAEQTDALRRVIEGVDVLRSVVGK